mgnify:CR=1 FL=1
MIIALTYYAMQIRNQNKTRQAQLLMQLYAHMREDKFNTQYTELAKYEWKNFDDFVAQLRDDYDFRAMLNYVCSFYEGVGVLVHRNLMDPRLVDDLMSSYIFLTWEKIGPYIKETRIRYNRPELWEYFEYLYEEIMKIYIQEHGHRFSPISLS